MNSIFITGTDTHVGKTYVSVKLIEALNQQGYQTFALKPIASGCVVVDNQLINEDALALMRVASVKKSYTDVNPYAFLPPIAPHLAATQAQVCIRSEDIISHLHQTLQPRPTINIIEGAGGWAIPLNQHELYADVIAALQIPTILVVAIKLGCLNHAILTAQSISRAKHPFIGWIANCLEPKTLMMNENIKTLETWINAPCLGVLQYATNDTLKIEALVNYVV